MESSFNFVWDVSQCIICGSNTTLETTTKTTTYFTKFYFQLGSDYKLKAIKENGPGGWFTATRHLPEAPGNWDEADVQSLLDIADKSFENSIKQLNIRGRVIRKKRAVGLCPLPNMQIPREALDETVLTLQDKLSSSSAPGVNLPRCIFNGGTDAWCDSGAFEQIACCYTWCDCVLR